MHKQVLYSLFFPLLIVSCGGDNSTSPSNENSSLSISGANGNEIEDIIISISYTARR